MPDEWSPASVSDELPRIPVLVLHGDRDGLIKETLGQEVYETFQGPKRFQEVVGGRHGSAFYEPSDCYRNLMYEQLERYVGRANYL